MQWLLAEGELEEALELVQPPQVCDVRLLRTMASKLPKAGNAEAVSLLLRVFAWEMPSAGTPYREMLDLVQEAATRMLQPQRDKWLENLRVEYKPKRNFIKGLNALKIAA